MTPEDIIVQVFRKQSTSPTPFPLVDKGQIAFLMKSDKERQVIVDEYVARKKQEAEEELAGLDAKIKERRTELQATLTQLNTKAYGDNFSTDTISPSNR